MSASLADRHQGRRTITGTTRARELYPERCLDLDPLSNRSCEVRARFLADRTERQYRQSRIQRPLRIPNVSAAAVGLARSVLSMARGRAVDEVTYRLTEGLSSAREPLPDAAPQPALPAEGPVRSSWQQFSSRADVCRVMPFRPCYPCVGPLPDPNLCYSCVGRSSRGQPPRPRRGPACLPAARRQACARPPVIQLLLRAGPGMARRDERNVRQ
jgi:hypothetical protein